MKETVSLYFAGSLHAAIKTLSSLTFSLIFFIFCVCFTYILLCYYDWH